MVKLSLNEDPKLLGDSFLSLERKLNKNLELRRDYILFLKEYEDMGHMSLIKDSSVGIPTNYDSKYIAYYIIEISSTSL